MDKKELLHILELCEGGIFGDEEGCHIRADKALLEYINDPEIAEAFEKIDKWYA